MRCFSGPGASASKDRACAKVEDAATVVTDLSDLAGCPVVVEAISEDAGTKRELYALLADVLDEDAVLATTTSSLSVAELAEASGRPDRFGALHVFNPVDRMKLVELSFPDEASQADPRSTACRSATNSGKPRSRFRTHPASSSTSCSSPTCSTLFGYWSATVSSRRRSTPA